MNYVKVCLCPSEVEAGAVVSLLKSNGFNPLEIRKGTYFQIMGLDTSFHVEVPENEAAQAIELLNDFEIPGTMNFDQNVIASADQATKEIT